MPTRIGLTGEGLRLTGDPGGSRHLVIVAPPAAFLLATEDGETLADDAGEELATEPDNAS